MRGVRSQQVPLRPRLHCRCPAAVVVPFMVIAFAELVGAQDLPQVQCEGANFGICVCEWATAEKCSIGNNDDSICKACCCASMFPNEFQNAVQNPPEPFPQPPTPAPVVRSVDSGFSADGVVKADGLCASVLGYIGRGQYVVRFISTGEMRAFVDTDMAKDHDCEDMFATTTATATGTATVTATTTVTATLPAFAWAGDECPFVDSHVASICLAYWALVLGLLFCCCCCCLVICACKKRRQVEPDEEDTEEELEKEPETIQEEEQPKVWSAAIYDNTLGFFFPQSAEALEQMPKQQEKPSEGEVLLESLESSTEQSPKSSRNCSFPWNRGC